jgi:hypothetical protein
VVFNEGKYYRVTRREELEHFDVRDGRVVEPFIFLEHPELPRVEFGFVERFFNE